MQSLAYENAETAVDGSVIGKSISYLIGFVLMSIYPFFKLLLPHKVTLPLFVLGGLIVVTASCYRGLSAQIKLKYVVPFFFLALLALLSSVAHRSLNSSTEVLVICCLVFTVLSGSTDWIKPAYCVVFFMAAIHCIATYVFFIEPSLYQSLLAHGAFSGIDSTNTGYKAALAGDHGMNALYLATGFLLSMSGVLASNNRQMRVWSLIASIAFFGALLLTTKRAHILFSIVAVLIMLTFSFVDKSGKGAVRGFLKACLIVGLSVAVIAIVAPDLFDSVVKRFLVPDSDDAALYTSGRTFLWAEAIEMWKQSPVIGNGWGTFSYTWTLLGSTFTSIGAHCVPLQLLAEVGLVGLALFIVMMVNFIVCTYRVAKHFGSAKSPESIFPLGIAVFFLLYSFTGNPLYDEQIFFSFFLACYSAIALLQSGVLSEARETALNQQCDSRRNISVASTLYRK
jgi:hypothetical protein